MDKSINLLASTQPGVEGPWAHRVCEAAKPLLEERGWKVFGPWQYDANGDLAELMAQRTASVASGASFTISVHIDSAGSTKRNGILMIAPAAHPEYNRWAEALGRIMAELTGLPNDGRLPEGSTAVKRLGIFKHIPGPNILVEIGEYSTAAEWAWLQANVDLCARSLATAIDRSTSETYGTEQGEEDDMTDDDRRLLRLARLSTIARSFDVRELRAAVKGDDTAADEVAEERKLAVAKAKAELFPDDDD